MMLQGRSLAWGLMFVVLAGMLTGCGKSRLRQERDALYAQNQELQDRLNQTRQALDGAEGERANYTSRIGQLEAQLAAERARASAVPAAPVALGPAPAPLSDTTAFSNIAGIESTQTNSRITVRVPGDVLFASGKATLKTSAEKTLREIADVIKQKYSDKRIRVEGYTDTDPIRKSGWKDNLDLSLERAATVHRFLQTAGVTPRQLEAVGLGEWHPRTSKEKSRRVEIVVVLNE